MRRNALRDAIAHAIAWTIASCFLFTLQCFNGIWRCFEHGVYPSSSSGKRLVFSLTQNKSTNNMKCPMHQIEAELLFCGQRCKRGQNLGRKCEIRKHMWSHKAILVRGRLLMKSDVCEMAEKWPRIEKSKLWRETARKVCFGLWLNENIHERDYE